MTSQLLISKIHCTLWANQTRDSEFSKNPSGKMLQNCFIHKSFTGTEKRNEQNSYYSLPLVGKSNGKDQSQHTLIGRNKNTFYWLIGEKTKLQRRTQLQRYILTRWLTPGNNSSICCNLLFSAIVLRRTIT